MLQLLDKSTGLDLATPGDPLALLELVVERPRDMSAWVIGDIHSRVRPLPLHALAVETNNPYVATLVAKARVRDSELTIRYSLKAGQPWLEVEVETTWLERGGPESGTPQLRMRFPTGSRGRRRGTRSRTARSSAGSRSGEEVPALRYADAFGTIQGRPAGLLLLNDGKHGHSLEGSTLALTLLRSSYEPDPLPEIGSHSIRMALVPHGGALTVAEMTRLGAAFNHPLQVVATDLHPGRLAPAGSALASVSPADVVVGAVKRAEGDGSIVFRLLETAGKGLDRPARAGVASRDAHGSGGDRPPGAASGEGHRPARLRHRERRRARARRSERPGSVRLKDGARDAAGLRYEIRPDEGSASDERASLRGARSQAWNDSMYV